MLKGHSKKRWKLVSSHCLLHIVYYKAHSYSLPSICSSSSSSLCLIDLWAMTNRKICAYQDCMRTRARRLEVRLLMTLATRNRPFLWSRNLNSRCSSICLLCLSPSFFLVLQPGVLLADLKLERIGERWTTSHCLTWVSKKCFTKHFGFLANEKSCGYAFKRGAYLAILAKHS